MRLQSLHISKCHIVGNHMSPLICLLLHSCPSLDLALAHHYVVPKVSCPVHSMSVVIVHPQLFALNDNYNKTCLKRPLKNRQNKGLKDK